MPRFHIGQSVEVGTVDALPDQSPIPYPGRVICNDAITDHEMKVLVLIKKNLPHNQNEVMYQFTSKGECLVGSLYGGHEDQNLYPVEEPVTTQPVKG